MPPPESRFTLTLDAEADLDEIAAYTLREWGRRQLESYMDDLQETFSQLAYDPTAGVDQSNIWPGARRVHVNLHLVFFVATAYGVRILRVLHERMDPTLHRFDDQ